MDATAETMGPRDFSQLLGEQFGLSISHQAVSKASYLPKTGNGRIIVRDALIVLADRGRISLGDDEPSLPLDAPVQPGSASDDGGTAEQKSGRPVQSGRLADEQILTERVKRKRMELDLAEREGQLLRADDVTDAMVAAGRRIGEAFEQLPTLADELVAAANSLGSQGVREILRREVRGLREKLTEAFTQMAAEEPEDDAS